MVLEMILPIYYCSIQKCQWKIWHIRQNGMSPVRHFCWKMSVMRGVDVMMLDCIEKGWYSLDMGNDLELSEYGILYHNATADSDRCEG